MEGIFLLLLPVFTDHEVLMHTGVQIPLLVVLPLRSVDLTKATGSQFGVSTKAGRLLPTIAFTVVDAVLILGYCSGEESARHLVSFS